MDTAQWPQEIVVKPMEEMVVPHGTACSKQQLPSSSLERKMRPQKEQAINCPRCNSTNTKFCYYNNYSLSQPRYFCKTCRRYWTEGGSLRNIPVGGGSRKNKRSSSSSSSTLASTMISSNPSIINNSISNPTSASPKNLPDLILHHHQNPSGQDLNLGFSATAHDFKTISELIQVPNFNSFLPMHIPNSDINPNSVFSSASGFSLPEFKPSSLGFSLDGGYGSIHHSVQESSGRLLFPFEDLKQASNAATASNDQNRDQNGIGDSTAGYWSGILGGGGEESGGGGGGDQGSW